MNKNYKKWIENVKDKEDIELLKNFSDKDIKEFFSESLSFGTAGIRSIMGLGTSRINKYTVNRFALGLAKYYKDNLEFKNKGVIIAHDTRNNSKEFAEIICSTLNKEGINSYLFFNNESQPTPILSYAINKLKMSSGIVITASHNPKEYNGIKVYTSQGHQLLPRESKLLSDSIESIENYFDISFENNKYISGKIIFNYYKDIKKITTENLEDVKFIFSSLHGTSYKHYVNLSYIYKYNMISVKNQNTEDGNFSNAKSINPVDLESYQESIKVFNQNKDVDFAAVNDGDADRLGVMINHNNELIHLTGNELSTIQFNYLVTKSKKKKNKLLIYSNVSSDLPSLIAKDNHINIKVTPTGFKWIGSIIKDNKKNYLYGFEESYGSLILPIDKDKDAIQSTLNIINMVAFYKKQNKTLVDVLNDIYKRYGYMKLNTISIKTSKNINDILDKFTKLNKVLDFNNLEIVDYRTKEGDLNQNMIKINFDHNWIAIRPSGTEPLIRFYMQSYNKDKSKADGLLKDIEKFLQEKIK